MCSRSLLALGLLCASAVFAQKPAIRYKPPPPGEDDRPLITEIVIGTQGTDYALKVEFNKEPWGEACGTRCANATVFIDTDANKSSGLKLKDPKAAENGADLALTIQGQKVYQGDSSRAVLRVKVRQFSEDSTELDAGRQLAELDPVQDSERVLAQGTSVYLLVDANIGDLPAGARLRVVYHPPDSKALVGTAVGLSAPGGKVELFKDGKLTNPVKKKKKPADYEKL
ncbi:MAG: hypothetical protein INH41_28480 [Myxococcaceae bacterium]|jgi:hypothetical protein|nr:hypothetical protein [Myxococcaceae bacterium]MCA3016338.1 hypothetical protein [Myxococcaceae bacterium]